MGLDVGRGRYGRGGADGAGEAVRRAPRTERWFGGRGSGEVLASASEGERARGVRERELG
jgi:hypothetical protein